MAYVRCACRTQDDGMRGKTAVCYKDYPGLGNRSKRYPYSSVGNTFTFDVVKDTGSNLTSNDSFIETLARASLQTYHPDYPNRYWNEAGRSAYGRTRYRNPQNPAVQRGGECYKDYPGDYLGLGNRSIFYPYSSVGNIFPGILLQSSTHTDSSWWRRILGPVLLSYNVG